MRRDKDRGLPEATGYEAILCLQSGTDRKAPPRGSVTRGLDPVCGLATQLRVKLLR